MSGTRAPMTPLSLMDPSLERTLKGHKNYITSVAFSSTLKQIASGSADNNVMLWNFKPQLRAFRYIGHKGIVTAVEFSPEGDMLASASKDKTVRLWTPNAMGESVTLKGHTGAVRSVKFSPDGKSLITGSDDKLAKVWSLPSRKFGCSLVGHSNWVRSACFGPSAALAATGADDKLVKLWDVPTHQCLHTFHDHNDIVNQVLIHPDGGCLSSASADKSIKIWDIKSHQLIQHYPAHSDAVTSIALHDSGFYMLSASKDSTLKIWDLREGRLLFTLQSHTGPVRAASFSKDGNFFASGGADQMVMVWKSNLVGVDCPDLDWGPASTRPVVSSSTSYQNGEIIKAMNVNPQPRKPGVPKRAALKVSNDENEAPKPNVTIPQVTLGGMSAPETTPASEKRTGSSDASAAGFVNREKLPESLAYTLDYIVGQLDIMTRTMALLEQRISMTEDRLSNVVAYSRGMVEVPTVTGRSSLLPPPPAKVDETEEDIVDVGMVNTSEDDATLLQPV